MSKLIDIIRRTYENGNPLKPVMDNTSDIPIPELLAMPGKDLLDLAFGGSLNALASDRILVSDNNPITRGLFKLECALRCKNLHLLENPHFYAIPVRPGQHYVAINPFDVKKGVVDRESMSSGNNFPGIDLIRRVGQVFVPEAPYVDQLVSLYSNLKEINYNHVKETLLEAAEAQGIHDLVIVEFHEVFDIYSSRNWLNAAYDVYLDSLDVYDIVSYIAQLLKENGCRDAINVKACDVLGEEGFAVTFEDNKSTDFRRILVHPTKGVFEGNRHRRFNRLLLVNEGTYAQDHDTAPAQDLHLLSSYNTFITWLLRFGTRFIAEGGYGQATKQFGLLFDRYLVNEEMTGCPLTSIDEQGAPDGDRQELEFSAAKVRTIFNTSTIWYPFTIQPGRTETGWVYSLSTVSTEDITKDCTRNPYSSTSLVDKRAFIKYNLVRMVTNGAFVDGRMTVLRLKDVPQEHREFVLEQAQKYYGNLFDWAAKYTDLGFDKDKMLAYLGEHLTLTLSSKATKFVKRTTMDKAVIAKVLNGESRGSINWGQIDASENNVLVPACLSMAAIGAAGNAYYWQEDGTLDIGTALVQKRVKNNPEITPIISKGAIRFTTYGAYTVSEDAGWTVLTFSNYIVRKGQEIIEFPYIEGTGEYGYSIMSQFEGAEIVEVRFRLANNAGNKQGLNIETTYVNQEKAFKARNYVKAVMVPYQRTILHNGLNGDDFFARAFFPTDTIKSADLVKAHYDAVCATYLKNKEHPHCQEGYALIRGANAAVGCSSYDNAVWSPVAAWTGIYDEILAQFDKDFGRSMWSTWREETPEWTHILKNLLVSPNGTMRKGWTAIKFEDLTEFTFMRTSIKLDTVRCYADGDISNPKTNIVVLGEGISGVHFFAQRAWCWVGTKECPVYQPIKCEVSTVTENVGYSAVMMGVIRNVAKKCVKTARTMTLLGDRRQQLNAALHIMARAKAPANQEPVTVLENGYVAEGARAVLQSDELRELVLDTSNKGRILRLLAQKLTKPFFLLGYALPTGGQAFYTLNLATIVAQDANSDYASDDSLSALTEQLFINLILTGEEKLSARTSLLISRIHGKLKKLVDNEGLNKAAAFGARSLGARAAGIPGIPCGEIWVPMSDDPRSVYRKWIGGFKHIHNDLDVEAECKVITYRAPMTEPIVQRIVVIPHNDPRHAILSAYTLNMNVIVNNIHGGDYDGDTYQISPAVFWAGGRYHEAAIALTTVFDVIRVVTMRTGSDQFVDDSGRAGGSYYADHNEIKLKKVGPSAKNLVLQNTVGKNLALATDCQFSIVGRIHKVVLLSDLFITLKQNLTEFGVIAKGEKRAEWSHDAHEKIAKSAYEELEANNAHELDNLVMSLYEIYEVPLGGYDADAYEALMVMLSAADSGMVTASMLSQLVTKMAAAGMNSSLAMPVMDMALTVHQLHSFMEATYYGPMMKSIFHRADAPSFITDLPEFILATVMFSFRVSKGDFIPAVNGDAVNSAYKLAMDWYTFMVHEDNKAIMDNIDKSMVLLPLKRFIQTTFKAIATSNCPINFDSLLDGVPNFEQWESDEDDDTQGDGGQPTPNPTPDDNNDGGTDMPEATAPNTPAPNFAVRSEPAALNKADYNFSHISDVWEWFIRTPEQVRALPEWEKLSPDQAIAVQRIACGDYNVVTVLGRAGSGKTFSERFVQRVLSLMGVESYLCGATGAATAIANGTATIFSIAGINIGNVLPEGLTELLPADCPDKPRAAMIQASKKASNFISGKPGPDIVIMVDEFSMLSSENLILIYQSLRRVVRKNRKIRFVFFGDFRQLSFIKGGDDFKVIKKHANYAFKRAQFTTYNAHTSEETDYFYGSLLTQEGPFRIDGDDFYREPWKTEVISLVTNHRQNTGDAKGAAFVEALNALGDGADFNSPALDPLMERIYCLNEQGKYINMVTHEEAPTNLSNGLNIYTRNAEIRAHNEKVERVARSEMPPCRTYTARISTNHLTEKQILGEVRPIPRSQEVFVGQKVMFRKNTQMPGLVNGSICIVTSVESKSIGLRIISTGEEYQIEKMQYPISETKHGVGGTFETPAMFHSAYGMTPWKTQGATVQRAVDSNNQDAVILNLNRIERTHGLLYVCCSRVEEIDQLYILVRDFNQLNRSVFCDPEIKEFIQLAENNTAEIMSGGEAEEATQYVVPELSQVTLGKSGNAVCGVRYDGRYYAVGFKRLGQYGCQPAFLRMQIEGNNFCDVDINVYHQLYQILVTCSQHAAKELLDSVA